MADLDFLNRIKRLAIIAMFSDDLLMERLVLKGGNLLDVVYKVSARSSIDVDMSMESEFETLTILRERVENALTSTFAEHGYYAFDIKTEEKPDHLTDDLKPFWGGYNIYFKIINNEKYSKHRHDVNALRRNAEKIGKRESTKFSVQISKHEWCEPKQIADLDGFQVYVYTPQLFVCEKIRAVCQQMEEYRQIVRNHKSPRARDFVDIWVVCEKYDIQFNDMSFQTTMKQVFDAKRVPVNLIDQIVNERDFHNVDFPAVQDTVAAGFDLQDFDFYFDFVVAKCAELKPLWDK